MKEMAILAASSLVQDLPGSAGSLLICEMERLGIQQHQLRHLLNDQLHLFQASCGEGSSFREQKRR